MSICLLVSTYFSSFLLSRNLCTFAMMLYQTNLLACLDHFAAQCLLNRQIVAKEIQSVLKDTFSGHNPTGSDHLSEFRSQDFLLQRLKIDRFSDTYIHTYMYIFLFLFLFLFLSLSLSLSLSISLFLLQSRNDVVCISYRANVLGKGMNSTIYPPSMAKQ